VAFAIFAIGKDFLLDEAFKEVAYPMYNLLFLILASLLRAGFLEVTSLIIRSLLGTVLNIVGGRSILFLFLFPLLVV